MSYDHGQIEAQKSAKGQLEFIIANLKHLVSIDKGSKMSKAAIDMLKLCERGTKLSPGQMSYTEGIYEKTMQAIGLPACDRKRDVKYHELRH